VLVVLSLKLQQKMTSRTLASSCIRRGLDWRLGKISSLKRAIRHWTRLSRAVVESPSLEGFKKHVDMAPRDMV